MRNRAKRRLRELYRLRPGDGAGPSCDIVANARRSSATAPWAELEKDFMGCLKQVRRLTAEQLSGGPPTPKE